MRTDTEQIPAPAPDTDDLVARLRDRRSADRVAATYAATHGHPVTPDDTTHTRRWSLGTRPGLTALVAVLLLACLTTTVILGPDWLSAGAVRPLTAAAATPSSPHITHDPTALASPPDDDETPEKPIPPSATTSDVIAHVVGAVHEPGLVELPGAARVADAVEAAGGPTDDADLSGVNLARAVNDGEQIHVPRPGESPASPPPGPPVDATDPRHTPVDVNTADAATLESLPGIGPALAAKIIDWRGQHGPFATVDELEDVPGIGPSILDQISDMARV